ncbi:Hypothetical_protein [Hexamita inflata]|uniref:Hypothetical_protein n=1 Tax=Hexamita inflata TaxID=28002 RepID=A0AA86TT46_9EUKA|nr:Hypothetical protein HINF_LOCUS15629 [Hexamita inflata]
MLAYVPKSSEEFNQLQISVSLSSQIPVQIQEAQRYVLNQSVNLQFFVNVQQFQPQLDLNKLRMDDYSSSDLKLVVEDSILSVTEAFSQFVLFTLRSGVVLPFAARQLNKFTVQIKDLVPVYLISIIKPESFEPTFAQYQIPRVLYDNRQSDALNLAFNGRKQLATSQELLKLKDRQRLLNQNAEKLEQQLYEEFKRNVLKIQNVTQFAVNCLQTEVYKTEATVKRFQKVINFTEQALNINASEALNQFQFGSQFSRTQKTILFDVLREPMVPTDQFQLTLRGERVIEDNMTSEMSRKYDKVKNNLQTDLDLYLKQQINELKSEQGARQIKRTQELLESSLALSRNIGTHNFTTQKAPSPPQYQTQKPAPQIVNTVVPEQTEFQPTLQKIDSEQTYQTEGDFKFDDEAEKMNFGQNLDEQMTQALLQTSKMQPEFQPEQRKMQISLQDSQIERKVAQVLKKFQITPNSYEEIKIPINIKEIEPVMTLAAYHYSKYLGLPTLKPLVLKEGKIRENFIVFYWGKVKMCVVLVVGKKATCYILENGSFVEVEVQTISKGQIQVVGGIFNDKEAKIQGFEIQVEGKSAYSIE